MSRRPFAITSVTIDRDDQTITVSTHDERTFELSYKYQRYFDLVVRIAEEQNKARRGLTPVEIESILQQTQGPRLPSKRNPEGQQQAGIRKSFYQYWAQWFIKRRDYTRLIRIHPGDEQGEQSGNERDQVLTEFYRRDNGYYIAQPTLRITIRPACPSSQASGERPAAAPDPIAAYLHGLVRRLTAPRLFEASPTSSVVTEVRNALYIPRLLAELLCDHDRVAPTSDDRGIPRHLTGIPLRCQSDLVDELLVPSRAPRVALVGWAGTGKTALLESVALSLAERYFADPNAIPARIPLLVDLVAWSPNASFEQHVDRCAREAGLDLQSAHLERMEDRSLVLLLDGLDAIRSAELRATVGRNLDCSLSQPRFAHCPAILTTRPWAFRECASRVFTSMLALLSLTQGETGAYIRAYYNGDVRRARTIIANLRRSPTMQSLASGSLLMLAMLCYACLSRHSRKVVSDYDLVRRTIDEFVKRRWCQFSTDLGSQDAISRSAAEVILQCAAGTCWLNSITDCFRTIEVLETISRYRRSDPTFAREMSRTRPGLVLEALLRHCGLVEEDVSGNCRFVERTLLEFLAAQWIARQDGPRVLVPLLSEHARQFEWRRVWTWVAEALWRGTPTQHASAKHLIRWLLQEHDSGRDDDWSTLATMAVAMLSRAPQSAVDIRLARRAVRAMLWTPEAAKATNRRGIAEWIRSATRRRRLSERDLLLITEHLGDNSRLSARHLSDDHVWSTLRFFRLRSSPA